MRRKILILLLLIPVVVLVAATIYQASRGGIFKKVAPAKFPESQSVDATLAQTADLQAPTVPSNLVATVVSTSQINLAWAASTDNVRVTGYRIYRCQGIGCTPTTQLIAVTGTTYQNIRLLANTTYVYSVAAYDSAANVSAQSSSVSATTPGAGDTTPPVISNGSPTGTLPAGTTQTTMSVITDENAVCRWSATTGTAYSSMTGTFSTTGATTHSTAITGLTNGTAYNRYLRCQDPAGNANTSDYIITFSIASASGADTQPPTIPSNLSATAISISQINLAWTASTDNVGVTGYRIYRCQGSGCTPSTQLTTTANTSYSDTSLTANTTYVYRVAAYDSAANVSAQSSSVSATTPGAGDTTPPVISNGSPTGTLPAGTTQTSMSVATNENAICRWSTTTGTAYSSMTGTFSTTGATTHSTAITGLSNGTAYNRYVKCQDPAGNANSADFTITFSIASGADTQAPTIPSNLTATAISVSQINLAWTASTDNVGVKGYRIYRCLGSGCTPTTQIAMVTGTTYQNTGLSTNKTYAYSVAAYDAAGKISGKSSSAQATTLGAPVTNHDPIGSFDAAASSNVSGWAYDQEAGANPINVDIYIDGVNRARISANLSRPDLVTSGVTPDANHGFNYSLTGLNLSVGNHTVNIYAINTPTGNNPLLAGSPKTINIPAPADTVAPSTPTNLSATAVSNTQINLAWWASIDNIGVTGYRIYRCQGSGCTLTTQLTTTANTSYSDSGLTANTTYVYRVAAYDSAGNVSGPSSSVSASTLPSASAKFSINDRVQAAANIDVRATPSLSGTLLGTKSAGAQGTVIGGPTYANGYWWWNINYDTDPDGWSTGDYLAKALGIQISSPILGDIWAPQSQHSILWTTEGVTNMSYAIFELYKGGSFFAVISSYVPNSGNFLWTLPNYLNADDYKIRISKYGNQGVYGESQTFSIRDPNLVIGSCNKIFGTADPAKALNIFFVGFAYADNQIFCPVGGCSLSDYSKILENDINRVLNNENLAQGYGLLIIEPFKSYLNKINVYMLGAPLKERTGNYYSYVFSVALEAVKYNCRDFKANDAIHFLTDKDVGGGGNPVSGSYRIVTSTNNYHIAGFIHELGHSLGLNDTYGVYRDPTGAHSMYGSYSSPNCDNTAGCPKWCSGSALPAYSTVCPGYATKSECESHTNYSCIWIDEALPVDSYFGARCISNSDTLNHNIGTSCLDGTGCYLGCSGQGFRPVSDENFANQFTQRQDALGKHTFEPVSERFAKDIFDCCYPTSCTNYNTAKCQDFSQRYSDYSSCNICR